MTEPARSPLADYYSSRGTPLAEYHGALVARHFSDAVKEHHEVRQSAGIFDFSFRAKFALKGDDRAKFLHRVASNDIKKLAPGQGTYATLLNAQGHILFDFRCYCFEDRLLIDTDADLRDKAMQALRRYIIGDRVQLEPVEIFTVSVQGPQSRALVEKSLHIELPLSQEYDHAAATFSERSARVVRATSTGEEGYEIWAEPAAATQVWELMCAPSPADPLVPCGTTALESLRIEAGIPRYGPDMGEDTLPLEAGLLNALSFNKGCYIGQEIVERARSRGHVNWKLGGILIDDAAAPASGTKLLHEEKEIGEITSACVSPTLSKTIALAYLRREVSEPGTKIALASGPTAEVTSLPFYTHPGASANA
jgi:glycine cleavage system T protein